MTYAVILLDPIGANRLDVKREVNSRLASLRTASRPKIHWHRNVRASSSLRASDEALIVFIGAPRLAGSISRRHQALAADAAGHPCPVIPVFFGPDKFKDHVPSELHERNGFLRQSKQDDVELANVVLETLGLLRTRRRIFISYVRSEARSVALQLHDYLRIRLYDPFLDTHEIRAGSRFQREVRHQVADADMIVLIDTKEVPSRQFVMEEVAVANALQIGRMRLVWPGYDGTLEAGLFNSITLAKGDFRDWDRVQAQGSQLTTKTLQRISENISRTRVDAHLTRERNVTKPVIQAAKQSGRNVVVKAMQCLVDTTPGGSGIEVDTVIGFPDALLVHDSCNRRSASPEQMALLVYNPIGITDAARDHLAFLENYLPAELLRSTEAEDWVSRVFR